MISRRKHHDMETADTVMEEEDRVLENVTKICEKRRIGTIFMIQKSPILESVREKDQDREIAKEKDQDREIAKEKDQDREIAKEKDQDREIVSPRAPAYRTRLLLSKFSQKDGSQM